MFYPKGPAKALVEGPVDVVVVAGKYVTEVRQTFGQPCVDSSEFPARSCGVTQTYRLFQSTDATVESYVEVIHTAGPLQLNRDLIVRFNTSLRTGQQFFSDDNCFESQVVAE